jgi:CRP/FNR family nitrogen fixation transcriptional regulator
MNWNSPAVRSDDSVWLHQRAAARRNPLEAAEPLATRIGCHRGQQIYEEDGAVDCWYRMVSGVARRFSLRADGRRQIVDLLLPDDVFGFGVRGRHRFAVEATVDGTVVAGYPRSRLESLASSDVRVARELQDAATDAMARLQTLILTLGRTTAEAKVGCFLLRMAERLSAARPGDVLVLPVSRDDIADYLTLSVETVSRALTQLKRRGVIRLLGTRRISIIDREAIDEGESDRFGANEYQRPPAAPLRAAPLSAPSILERSYFAVRRG